RVFRRARSQRDGGRGGGRFLRARQGHRRRGRARGGGGAHSLDGALVNPAAYLDQATRRMGRHDFVGAIEMLRIVLAYAPDHARAHAMLSICLLRTRRRFAAEHEARRALALEPELPDAHIALGWVALARHAFSEAEGAFRA